MKNLAYVLFGFVSIFCLTGIISSNVEASDYLGDFCWQSQTEDGIVIMKVGVSHMGGGHYLLAGKMIKSDGTLHNIVNGNAEIVGNNIYMTLVHSGKGTGAMWTGSVLATLDISTLNGTFEAIGHDRNYSDQPFVSGGIFIDSDTQHETGSVTFITCPQ